MTGKFQFGTKAESLNQLVGQLENASIPKFSTFRLGEWLDDRAGLLSQIADAFGSTRLIIRSSASSEDSAFQTMAGLFESVPNVDSMDENALSEAIDAVFKSYERLGQRVKPAEHIIVQEMVGNVSMSGVVFTQDIRTGAPYYVINYDDETGRTDTITAGSEYSNRSLYVLRSKTDAVTSERFQALLRAVQEIEALTGENALDIEFATGSDNQVYLLQVRQITTARELDAALIDRIEQTLERVQEFVANRLTPSPNVHGPISLFGQMPDWNPVEILGRVPRQLAFSLYRYLVTDKVWRLARELMGYGVPHGMPLMVSLGGIPYVDARLSFNSFLPADLPDEIGGKLVTAWIERLVKNQHLHDRIEFEVAIAEYTFDIDRRCVEQMPGVLTPDEQAIFTDALYRMTKKLVTGLVAPMDVELQKISLLNQRRGMLKERHKTGDLSTVASLLEDCCQWGTLPFAVLARHGFIAQALLRSLVRVGVIREKTASDLLNSIETVATTFISDARAMTRGEIDTATFMVEYGHLRPGTYDISSPRYDQRPDLFADEKDRDVSADVGQIFELEDRERDAIEAELSRVDFRISVDDLIKYIKAATVAREYSKFVFSRNISDALEYIAKWGETIGLSRMQLSHINIYHILDCLVDGSEHSSFEKLAAIAAESQQAHEVASSIHLPYLIPDALDVYVVPLLLARPNFVTNKFVHGKISVLTEEIGDKIDIDGKIVLTERADPGYDWIFSHSIKALVTKYGGSNSHMAIRCAEFDLPAAIGCGEQIFERLRACEFIEIDCKAGRIEPVGS